MPLLRLLYNTLAVIGACAIAFAAVSTGANLLEDRRHKARVEAHKDPTPVRASTPNTPAAPAAPGAEASAVPVAASAGGIPLGRREAGARALLVARNQHLFVEVQGQRHVRTTDVWIERHGRHEYLWVTFDPFVLGTPRTGLVTALRLPDGSVESLSRQTLASGHDVAVARFRRLPPDSLLLVAIPPESLALGTILRR